VEAFVAGGDDADDSADGAPDQHESEDKVSAGAGIGLCLTGIAGIGEQPKKADAGEEEHQHRPEAKSARAGWGRAGFQTADVRHRTYDTRPGVGAEER
jgi:hypothetical protein